MRYFKRSISYFTGFLTEDRTKQSFFSCKFCLSLRSNLTYQDISGADFCSDTDDSSFIQILQCIITNTWNVACDLFWSKLCITCFCFIFFNMNRSIYIILHQSFTKQNSILVVVTFPCHESDQRVLSKSKFTIRCRWSICNNLAFFDSISFEDDWSLVITVALVTSLEFC